MKKSTKLFVHMESPVVYAKSLKAEKGAAYARVLAENTFRAASEMSNVGVLSEDEKRQNKAFWENVVGVLKKL